MKIDGTTTASPAPTRGPGLTASKDEFLRLFMAQLQHQDPFAPTSGADMVAQLAQLSAVEEAKQTNTQLAELTAAQTAAANGSLSSLVGRECRAVAGSFTVEANGGGVPPLELACASPMRGAALVIRDAAGEEVRRIPIADGATTTTVAWDGKDAGGHAVADGTYQLEVDAGTTSAPISTSWVGRVDAVELTASGPRLRMGGILVLPGDIRTIGQDLGPRGQEA